MKKRVVQKHHLDYQYPYWTIQVRKGDHLILTRKQNMNPTQENIDSIQGLMDCLYWIRLQLMRRLAEIEMEAEG